MFKPLDEGGLGIEELRFLTPQVWGSLFRARSGYEKCDVGFLPDKG